MPVLADLATADDGHRAADAGADAVASTLSGYGGDPLPEDAPPTIELVRRLSATLRIPVLAEGRYRTAAQVEQAMHAGACAVVVGTAITRPSILTAGFAAAVARGLGPGG